MKYLVFLIFFTVNMITINAYAEICNQSQSSIGNIDYDPSPSTDSNLSISSFQLSEAGSKNWKHEIVKTISPGGSFSIIGELKLRNKSPTTAKRVDIDYRADHGRNFDTDDTKIDQEKELEISGNTSITKHMGHTTIRVSSDGMLLTVEGEDHSESFPFVNNFVKFYVFVDVENKDTGDDDISSNHSKNGEYGVVKVTVGKPEFCNSLPQLKAEIANLQRSYDSHYSQERQQRAREKHYRSQYSHNRSKYKKYKKKYQKKGKSKYKKKYKKYRARAKSNKEKYEKADQDKNWHEAAKKRISRILEKKRSEELQCN